MSDRNVMRTSDGLIEFEIKPFWNDAGSIPILHVTRIREGYREEVVNLSSDFLRTVLYEAAKKK